MNHTQATWREHVGKLHYEMGHRPPNYPVPATTLNALIAVPYENIMPQVKVWLLEQE
jgi:hypothetical protein